MSIIKNVSPLGDLDVPLLGRILKAGAEIEVSDEVAARLLPQAENYEPVDDAAHAVLAELNRDPDADEPESDIEEDSTPAAEPPAEPIKPTTKRTRRQS